MVKVIDIPLYNADIASAVEVVLQEIANGQKSNYCISATGAHGMVYATKNLQFKTVLNEFYMNLPDGMPGVWIGRLKGARQMRRCYGPDFFRELMRASADKPITHFFCGGKEGVADELKRQCELRFNNKNIVGTYCPPFRALTEDEWIRLGESIKQSKADIVWIGLSTPKQEQFAYKLRSYTKTHFIITVGAAFDFHTGKVKQAPAWVQKIGMEWFFRLTKEPKRLYKRYLEIVPLFIYYNLKEFIYSNIFKKQLKTK